MGIMYSKFISLWLLLSVIIIILGKTSEGDRNSFHENFLIWNQADPGSDLTFDV